MDHQIFLAINGLAGRTQWFDTIARFIGGDWFFYLFALGIALLWFHLNFKKRVYLAFISAAIAYGGVVQFLKHVITRSRPFEILTVHQLIIDNERGNSFPSGHTALYFALAFSFWGTKYFWPFFVLAVLGGLGRVVVGVHYPLDVLAGAIIGASVSLLLRGFSKRHFR